MKSFIGTGTGSVKNAIESATGRLYLPNLILFYAPYDKLEETAAELRNKYPQTESIGTCGTRIVNGQCDENTIIVVGFFDDVRVQAGVIEHVSKCPIVNSFKLTEQIKKIKPSREDTVCIEYCTGNEEVLVSTFASCLEGTGIKLAGGTVFGVPDGKKPVTAYNGKVYTDSCVYAFIKNNTGRIKVFKENIYRLGENSQPHYATDVDTASRTLKTLDRHTAAEVYSAEMGIPKNKIIDNVFKNPMGRVVGDEVYIASMKELLPGGSITNFKRINKNDCIYFLELGDYMTIEDETRKQIEGSLQNISLVLSVDCIYRYLFYQQEDYFDTYIKNMASLGNHVGIIGGGEQFNNQHVNQTMVCAVFE